MLECGLVIAGNRHRAHSELLAAAGAAVDNGVLVDERCRTSLPDVLRGGRRGQPPASDLRRLRVEHWNNGQHQGGRRPGRCWVSPSPTRTSFVLVGPVRARDRVRRVCRGLGPPRLPGPAAGPQVPRFLHENGIVRAPSASIAEETPKDPKPDGELRARQPDSRRVPSIRDLANRGYGPASPAGALNV